MPGRVAGVVLTEQALDVQRVDQQVRGEMSAENCRIYTKGDVTVLWWMSGCDDCQQGMSGGE
ncbi:hypothetical protein C450_04993 [Halococcus salifodinae DSM 8989]|uniref:Uncharacterized protein n=1 Tax=Halococcus salifodinae DSM 8989 TaxID=1227456 RepID=M0NA77_9EURY|nr:hypothetical protein C450_04993 [Halococcus salifodinae DSM 8989]